ncbi:MAG: hypothetical protein ABI857_10310 [Acidobacteriota bacterium]
MKLLTFAFAVIQILTFSLASAAQDKDKLARLPADATLADSQAWIIKNLPKNFGYSLVDDTVKISSLKFDGCTLSYRVFQRYTDQKAALGDRPGLGVTGATTAIDLAYSVYEDVWIELADIDPSRVALGPLPQSKMQVIVLDTEQNRDTIKFDRKGSKIRYNETGMRNTTSLPVKESAGESLGLGLRHTIQLCRAQKSTQKIN